MKIINIILADDHALIRAGYRSILEDVEDINMIGEAEDGNEAVAQVKALNPDVIVLDITMPNKGGLDAVKEIREINPEIKILMLSMHKEEAYIKQSIENGANGYLVKDTNSENFIKAIRTIYKGERFYGETSTKVLMDSFVHQIKQGNSIIPLAQENILSKRETEVIAFVISGMSSNEIAEKLFLSKRTIDNHRANIMHKFKVNNVVDLIVRAKEQGYPR